MHWTLIAALILSLAGACNGDPPAGPPTNDGSSATNSDLVVLGTNDGADGATTPLEPIDAPLDEWTWVPFDNARCGNGAPTGIGVNLTDRSDDVFVYFQGGGACWDVNSCFVLNAAVNIESGYGPSRFANEVVLGAAGFDRDESRNPMRDMNYVFIPYCTGDFHAGDKVTTYAALGQSRDVHHVGGANVQRFLARLQPTFADAPRVFVSGSSAGGYAAQLNFHRFAAAFPEAEVHALSDCGPLVQPHAGRFGDWKQAWSLQTPEDCIQCDDGLPQWHDYLTQNYPTSRFGLLAYDADQVVHTYWAYPVGNSFVEAFRAFADNHIEPAANAEAFVLASTQHVMLGGLTTTQAPNGTTLSGWIDGWVTGTDWTTIRP